MWERLGESAWPFVVGLVSVLLATRSGRISGRALAVGLLAATTVYLAVSADRVAEAIDSATGHAPWFALTALVSGTFAGAATVRLTEKARAAEGLLLLAAGMLGAAAALPDVEMVLGAVALWLPWGAIARRNVPGSRSAPEARPLRSVASVAMAIAVAVPVALALVDGARGRPGALLVAPIVVAPIVLLAWRPGRHAGAHILLRVTGTLVVVVLVARHAALGAGTAAPIIGSLLGTVVLAIVGLVLPAAAGDSDHPQVGAAGDSG